MKIAIFEESRPVRTCDPGPAHLARRLKTSEESLTDLQKAIYNFVKSKGKVTKQEITDKFTRSQVKTENQLSILRYLALTKAKKEGEETYIVTFWRFDNGRR